MRKKILIGILLVTACTAPIEEVPLATSTPTSTPTVVPSPTITPTSTSTPEPTATEVVPIEPIAFGTKVEYIIGGGYSYLVPYNYHSTHDDPFANVENEDDSIMINMGGMVDIESQIDPEGFLNNFILNLGSSFNGEVDIGEEFNMEVGGYSALGLYFSGTMNGENVQGKAISVMPSDTQFFFASQLVYSSDDNSPWERGAESVFDDLMATVEFLNLETEATGICSLSTDAAYGTTMDRPIQLAGSTDQISNSFDGPARARAFFDSMNGPNGESLQYQRVSSMPYGETILDQYQVTYAGQSTPIIIYVDQYSWSTLYVPIGLGCSVPFPLEGP